MTQKKLEDVIGIDHIDFTSHTIDFSELGIKYQPRNLIGYGFDSCCATCDRHYAVIFVKGNEGESTVTRNGSDIILTVPIVDKYKTGTSFTQYLYDEMYKHDTFVDHFQQYTRDGAKITVYDDRGTYDLRQFYTSTYRLVIAIEATYTGPDILVKKGVASKYNTNDVKVKALLSTGEYEDLDSSEYILSSDEVNLGTNTYTVTFNDKPSLTDTFTVLGYRKVIKVECEYVGPDIHIYHDYKKEDVRLRIYYEDDPAQYDEVFHDDMLITNTYIDKDGENWFTLKWNIAEGIYYEKDQIRYMVPGVGINYLFAKYSGPDVWKNSEYSLDKVKVFLVYKDNYSEPVQNTDCIFNPDRVIHEPYDNVYQVSWTDAGGNEWTAEYTVIGIAVIKIVTEYVGPDILLLDDYESSDVKATAYVSNGTKMTIYHTQCQFDDKIITWTGPNNKKHLTWIDPSHVTWNVEFIVTGIRRPLQLDVEYVGKMKYLDDTVYDTELVVTIHYLTDYFDEEKEILNANDWYWESLNIIKLDNDGEMKVGWTKDYIYTSIKLSASTKVPYISLIGTKLLAWYEGPDIEVGNLFNKNHVVVYLCPPDEDRIRLHYYSEGIIMDISEITHVGDNWYEVVFIKNGYKFTAKYPVPGVIYKEYPNPDFKVWYVIKDSLPGMPEEIDLTEDFRPYFTFREQFVISWEQFLKRVYDYAHRDFTPYFGMFGITAPKGTGLYNKYASTWHVYCFDDHTLKAEIFKLYDLPIKKEDNDDGGSKEEES